MTLADSEDLLGPLLVIFTAEAAEHLQAMNRHLLDLEQGTTDPQLRAELFREAHSLKGAARAVNLLDVERLAHELENAFTDLTEHSAPPSSTVLDRAYRTLDAIQTLLEARQPSPPPSTPPPSTPPEQAEPLLQAYPPQAEPPRTERPETERPETERPQAGPSRIEPGQADPVPPTGGADPGSGPVRAQSETVRIATAKLDALMAEVGELLVSRVGVEQRLADVRALDALLAEWASAGRPRRRVNHRAATPTPVSLDDGRTRLKDIRVSVRTLRHRLEADVRRMAQVTADLQDDVRRIRMVPVAGVFEVFPRMVRDLASAAGKEATLLLAGGQTEVDRSLCEQVKDPLTHLLRNSVDHGIELPAERAAAGKPRRGTIMLSARQQHDMLIIELGDDGAGIDPSRVRAAALRRGLLGAETELTDREAVSLVFRAGLSTSAAVTDLSGRGVGLDIVRDALDRLHGSVDLHSTVGVGTTFTLALPLSVSTMHCLLVEAGGQTFALPAATVRSVLRIDMRTVQRADGRQVVLVGGRPVPLADLAGVLGVDPATGAGRATQSARPDLKRAAAVLGGHRSQVALLVDRLAGTRELVIKSLPPPLARVRHVAGAAVLGSGEIAVILNATDLVGSVERAGPARPTVPTAPGRPASTILVVEDSITTRTLEKNVLEAAGYRVETAADGLAGWAVLQSVDRGLVVDLVVADIEMPNLDGLQLTARIRADPRFVSLPVVLVTSRDSREDRERGVRAGADAYIVKGGFDQATLLDTIRRLT